MKRVQLIPRAARRLTVVAAAALAAGAGSASGADAGSLDSSFTAPAVNDIINTVAVQADGKILIGGDFTEVAGETRRSVARLNADGTLDAGFAPNVIAGGVQSIAVQSDGKIVLGGQVIISEGGQTRFRLARLNVNGTVDTTFDPPEPDLIVYSVAIQPDGKVLIGGYFNKLTYGGVEQLRSKVARLNANGSFDSSFENAQVDNDTDPANPNSSGVESVVPAPDGKVLIGGDFRQVGGLARDRLARLLPNGDVDPDGILGFGFNNPHLNNTVESVDVQPDGKVIAGGGFSSVGNPAHTQFGIARVEADGARDATFADPDVNGAVSSVRLQADGRILLGGFFTRLGISPRNNLARLNTDGTIDTTFADRVMNASDVTATALQPDGKAVAVGYLVGAPTQGRAWRVLSTVPQAAPTAATATAGNGQATVSWTAVAGEISEYAVTASPGGRTCTTSMTSCTVTGLTNGAAYTFTVRAANAFGPGPASSATAAVTPRAPGQPVVPTQPGGESGQPPSQSGEAGKPQASGGTAAPAPRRLASRTSVRRGIASTTGTVPTGATRIIQTARSGARLSSLFLDMALQARVRTVTGRCAILRPARQGAARTYRCQMRLAKGTWTVTTIARGRTGVVAKGVRKVRVR